jgi:hypothetical protein
MDTPVKYAIDDLSVGTQEGSIITLRKGDSWAADDPIVTERPDLFSDEPTVARRSSFQPEHVTGVVEQATRNPAQRRG